MIRLETHSALRVITRTLPAHSYNTIHLALLRRGAPLRLELPALRGMVGIISREAWICVYSHEPDLPLLAWTGFERKARALHEPVRCELRVYHINAGLIVGPVLENLERVAGAMTRET